MLDRVDECSILTVGEVRNVRVEECSLSLMGGSQVKTTVWFVNMGYVCL